MLGVAMPTMAQQKKTTAKRTTTTTKKSPPTTAKPATGSATNSNVARGDLGIFELKGPVKSFVFKNQWGETTRTFDKNGTWLTKDGQSLKQIYQSGIRRDKNGRIVKGIMDSDGNGEEYYYNAKGWITKRTFHYYDTTQEDTYTYDANGKLLKMRVVEGGLDASEPYTEVYETLATDEFGNWTKRYSKIGSEKSIETRTITYYEGPKPTTTPHQHNYVVTRSFGTPLEIKTKRPVEFAFPKEVTVSYDDLDEVFIKEDSDLGDNIYICKEGLGGLQTLEDAEQHLAEINDSLQMIGSGYVLRLATMKEASLRIPTLTYEGDGNSEFYFKDQFIIPALEYNKDRNGTAVAPDHVNVLETITQKCACGDIKSSIVYQRQFKNMSQCQAYIKKRKK